MDVCFLSDCSINYNCPTLKGMALGILGGVALMGFYFKPYPTVPNSVNESYSSIFNDTSVPSFFFPFSFKLFFSTARQVHCLPLCFVGSKAAAELCVSIWGTGG